MLSLAGDYWGQEASSISLLHTWSLSIEEQFYLFLPIILFLLTKWNGQKFILSLLTGIFIGSFVWCIIQTQTNQPAAFFLLTTRAWELIAGSILAILAPKISGKIPPRLSNSLSFLGLAIIFLAYIFIDNTGFPGWKACLPVLGTFLFIGCSSKDGIVANLFSKKPFVYVGRSSYSLYLWHWPCLVLGQIIADVFEIQGVRYVGFLLSIVIALYSFHYIEPLGKKIKNIWAFFISSLGVLVAIAVLASYNSRNLVKLEYATTTSKMLIYQCKQTVSSMGGFQEFGFRGINLEMPKDINVNANIDIQPKVISSELKPDIIILGDSHGLMWASLIERVAIKNNTGAIFWTMNGVAPFIENKAVKNMNVSSAQRAEFNRLKLQSIAINKPKVVVVITRLDTKWHNASAEESALRFKELIETLHKVSPESKILILDQPPVCHFGNQNAVQWLGMRNKYHRSDTANNLDPEGWQKGNKFVRELPQLYTYVNFVPVSDIYLDVNRRVKLVEKNNIIYIDDDHLSEFGASLAETRIQTAIEQIFKVK